MTRPRTRRSVAIHELLTNDAAIDKLGARGISVEEARQLPRNEHTTTPNRGRTRRGYRRPSDRRLLVGDTDGGRTLTIVIERTMDPTTWMIVTGWPTPRNRRKLRKD